MAQIRLGQLQVLNKVLTTGDFSIVLKNNLTEDHFFLYKAEFNYIKTHFEKYGVVPDPESFISRFSDFDRVEVTEPDSYLLEEVLDQYKDSLLKTTYNRLGNLINQGKITEATDMIQKALDSVNIGTGITSVDILKDKSRLDDYKERAADFNKFFVTTGFKELDTLIGGWDRSDEYALIVARTNNGKSLIALASAIAAAKAGLKVGLYSGEMTSKKVGYRADSLISHINNGFLIHGNIAVKAEYERYMEALPGLFTKGELRVVTPDDIPGDPTVSALRAWVKKEQLDILFVDQVSLLTDEHRGRTSRECFANISKDLKRLQTSEHIPIIAVAQLNRTKNEDADDDSIDTSQIAESDRLDQDASTVIGIIRDKKDSSVLKLQIVKCRDGRKGDQLIYQCDLGRGEFNYVPCEKDQQDTSNLQDRYAPVNQPATDKVF